jgi:tungstate transport system substrate-binding protein
MKLTRIFLYFLLGSACYFPVQAGEKMPVRVAVIGGMTLGGMWPDLAEKFTKDTGWPVELVATGPKAVLAEALAGGNVDLVTLHASDEATEMAANGLATKSEPWARNEHCIMGPAADPAGIRGMSDGAAALRKIAESKSPFVDFMGPGSREVSHRLWKAAGVEPKGDWVLKDESPAPQGVVEFAAAKKAYVIVGRIPVLKGKILSPGMEVMVQGDPAMRRPYVVMIADEKKFPASNQAGAKVLHAWMTGEPGQAFLRDYDLRNPDAPHLFFPAKSEVRPSLKTNRPGGAASPPKSAPKP